MRQPHVRTRARPSSRFTRRTLGGTYDVTGRSVDLGSGDGSDELDLPRKIAGRAQLSPLVGRKPPEIEKHRPGPRQRAKLTSDVRGLRREDLIEREHSVDDRQGVAELQPIPTPTVAWSLLVNVTP
jgi:hypothetical protein